MTQRVGPCEQDGCWPSFECRRRFAVRVGTWISDMAAAPPARPCGQGGDRDEELKGEAEGGIGCRGRPILVHSRS